MELPYTTTYYRENAIHLCYQRKKGYCKKKYGFTTDAHCVEFMENRKLYKMIMKNIDVLNPEIVQFILENKIRN